MFFHVISRVLINLRSIIFFSFRFATTHNKALSFLALNPLTPNDPYSGRTAPLTSKRFILYIYSKIIRIEYFKRGIYSPFLSLPNAVFFIILTYLVLVLFTFYIQGVLNWKKIIPAPNGSQLCYNKFVP